jgi:hypothetical protein
VPQRWRGRDDISAAFVSELRAVGTVYGAQVEQKGQGIDQCRQVGVGALGLFIGQRGIDVVRGHWSFLSLHRSNSLLMGIFIGYRQDVKWFRRFPDKLIPYQMALTVDR